MCGGIIVICGRKAIRTKLKPKNKIELTVAHTTLSVFISQRVCHSSMLKVSARRIGSIFACFSNASEALVGIYKPDESELRNVLRFWLNPALIILKNDSMSSD